MSNVLRGTLANPEKIYGKSAYEIAVMHGFDGTEEEWLDSIVGDATREAEGFAGEAEASANEAKSARYEAKASEGKAGEYAELAQSFSAFAKNNSQAANTFANKAYAEATKAEGIATYVEECYESAVASSEDAKSYEASAREAEKNAKASEIAAADSATTAYNAGYEAASKRYDDLKISWDEEKEEAIAAIEDAKQSMIEAVEAEIADEKEAMLSEIEKVAEIVQDTGDSETAVMSQKAVSRIANTILEKCKISWEKGSIASEGGYLLSSETRIRTPMIYVKDIAIAYVPNAAYKIRAYAYNKFEKHIGTTDLSQEIDMNELRTTYPNCKYVRFLVKKNSDEPMDATTDVSASRVYIARMDTEKLEVMMEEMNDKLAIGLANFAIGSISSTDGTYDIDNNERCSTGKIPFDANLNITIDDGYEFYLHFYNSKTYIGNSGGWLANVSLAPYSGLGADTFAITVRNPQNAILSSDVVSAMKNTVTLYKNDSAIIKLRGVKGGDFTRYGLPVLELTGNTTNMTKDNAVTLNYKYGTRTGTCTCKWQGSSSVRLGYPKRNYTIKFDNPFVARTWKEYDPETGKEIDKSWGEQRKYCMKANWIDPSAARNIVNARLWGQVVASRTNKVTDGRATAPNKGAVDGFPIIITTNGMFEGLYTFNIPKDSWMFDMGNNGAKLLSTEFEIGSISGTTGIPYDQTEKSRCRSTALPYSDSTVINAHKGILFFLHFYNGDTYLGNSGAGVWLKDMVELSTYSDMGATDFKIVAKMETEANFTAETASLLNDKIAVSTAPFTKEYVVCSESNSMKASLFKDTATFDGDETKNTLDYSVEYVQDGLEDSVAITAFNQLIRRVMDAGEDWETSLSDCLDIDSVVDYFIFANCIGGHDNLGKNILYGTYNGSKWFMSAYDLDTTYGSEAYGQSWHPVVNDRTQFAEAAKMHKLAELLHTHSRARLKARYKELRATVLSDENVWYMLTNFVAQIPKHVYNIDTEKWAATYTTDQYGRYVWMNMPGTSTANVSTYMDYYRMHCAYLDKEIDAL